MSSTPPADPLPLERWLAKPVLFSAISLGGAVALAWGLLLAGVPAVSTGGMEGMEGMSAMPGMPEMAGMATTPLAPWSAGYLIPSMAMWALMMVAMMLPSAAPMVLLHARIHRGTPTQRTRDNALFMIGYLIVWGGFSLLATIAQAALVAGGLISELSLALDNRTMASVVLFAAAAWQLTPGKRACLEQCQSPIQFVMRYWRPGPVGAIRLGLVHGLYCVGCCWSLMLLLFVGGVMNWVWVALLATLVFVEKVAPPPWHLSRWLAALLAAMGIGLLFS